MLDPQLWEALEAHGVTHAHLEMLARLLEVQKNGSLSWHFVHGQVQQVETRLMVSSRRLDLLGATDALSPESRATLIARDVQKPS
jgi:hypothetical protein